VYPFYGIAVALSTYGFPIVISKLYALESEKIEKGNMKQLLTVSGLFLLCVGLLCFSLLYLGAESLAEHMDDPQLAPLLRMVAWVFLLMPVISLFRGFFQGSGDMIPTAVSQIGEQFIRVATILVASLFLMSQSYSLYIVGRGAVFGSITGGLVSVIILLLFWFRRGSVMETASHRACGKGKIKAILTVLTVEGFTICVSSMLLIFIQLADSLNLYALLVQSGIGEEEAKEWKGVYDRGQPLIQLGTVVATSMSLSLVPLITREKMRGNAVFLQGKIDSALKISIFVGAGATIGLWNIIKPTNMLLFENTTGSNVLALLSTLIFLGSVIMTVTAILQGLGSSVFPALVILSSLALKYGFNELLVEKNGITGAALASILALVFILVLLIIKLRTMIGTVLMQKRFFITVVFAAAAMIAVLQLYLYLTDFIYTLGYSARLVAGFQALTAVIVGGVVYTIFILRGNVFKEEELSLLPFGSKLMIFLPKKNRR
jgi:PST family polysaccharide transporter